MHPHTISVNLKKFHIFLDS